MHRATHLIERGACRGARLLHEMRRGHEDLRSRVLQLTREFVGAVRGIGRRVHAAKLRDRYRFEATATELRDYLAALKGYAGINGIYDFTKTPQRGLDVQGALVTLWNPTQQTWQLVSKPTGIPLDH